LSPNVDPTPTSAAARRPNPETVGALLDITWRIVDAEDARREGINGKASSLATFASLVLSLTATLGGEFLILDDRWQLTLYLLGLVSLVASVAVAVLVLLPRQRQMFSISYLDRLPTRPEVAKAPEEVQGEAMRGLIAALKTDRDLNRRNAQRVFRGFLLLFFGLSTVAVEAAVVAVNGSP
jgi:hypothetical protein